MGEIESTRIEKQLELKDHDCQSLIHVYDGGEIENRLFLLMSRASGRELEQCLPEIPRTKIRNILHDIAKACLYLRDRDLCHRDIKAANVFVSDDFSNATLLDISVIRAVHDPVGVGSDHNGQLPVLATARYSPPEYLFRLVEPGPELWHALDIYQLGALLHDLIARTPLFQQEYEQSKANRYRFAWIVATENPSIKAHDVDQDLLLLAQRALDKDWRRRSVLQIEDFLNDSAKRQRHAFRLLGIDRHSTAQPISKVQNVQETRVQLDEASRSLEEHLVSFLREGKVTATHKTLPGLDGDNSRIVELAWATKDEFGLNVDASLQCKLRLAQSHRGAHFELKVELATERNGDSKLVDISLPDIPVDDQSAQSISSQTEAAFASLANRLTYSEGNTS